MEEENYVVASPDEKTSMVESYKWAMSSHTEDKLMKSLGKRTDEDYWKDALDKDMKPINIYTERLLACLVSVVQPELEGMEFGKEIQVKPSDRLRRGFKDVLIPVRLLLSSETDQNYSYAIKAAENLQAIVLRFRYENGIKLRNFITATDADFKDGHLLFSVANEVWDLLFDFSSGFRKTEFWVVRSLRKAISYRFYKLVAGQKNPLVFKISDLAAMFNVSESSSSTASAFKNRVLDPVRKELDAVAPWSFSYSFEKSAEQIISTGHRGRPSYDLVRIIPRHIVENERNKRYLKDAVPGHTYRSLMDTRVVNILKERYGMTSKEIDNWGEMILEADKVIPGGLLKFLIDKDLAIMNNSETNKKGYLYTTIKNEVEKYG